MLDTVALWTGYVVLAVALLAGIVALAFFLFACFLDCLWWFKKYLRFMRAAYMAMWYDKEFMAFLESHNPGAKHFVQTGEQPPKEESDA